MTILTDAEALVSGPRQSEYGPPADNLNRIAHIWSALLGHQVSASDVALCMAGLKLARAAQTLSNDSLTDAAGYLRLIEMMGSLGDTGEPPTEVTDPDGESGAEPELLCCYGLACSGGPLVDMGCLPTPSGYHQGCGCIGEQEHGARGPCGNGVGPRYA